MFDLLRYNPEAVAYKTREVFNSLGWETAMPSQEQGRAFLEQVGERGVVSCIDPRDGLVRNKLGQTVARGSVPPGPKIMAGVVGVAAFLNSGQPSFGSQEIYGAIERVQQRGYTSSTHGDDHNHEYGCGGIHKLSEGTIPNLPKLTTMVAGIKHQVLGRDGLYYDLEGGHAEEFLVANTLRKTTPLIDPRYFPLDVWFADELGIDTAHFVSDHAELIKQLRAESVKKVVIIK